ncbi:hypothetical protein HG530_001258 [Fusarium avenaceum]|nr:hypothetical protein HG530_001258 [Fusarium avenaceum]
MLHAEISNLSWLAILHTLALLQLIQEHQVGQFTKRDVEQRRNTLVEAKATDDDRSKGVCHSGGDVEAQSHANEQPRLGLDKRLQSLRPREVATSSSSLVGAESFDRLEHVGRAVGAVPTSHAHWLFSTSVPLRRDDGEEWETSCFEETKQEASCQKTLVGGTCRHACLSGSPAEDKTGHKDAMGNLDHEPGGEGQPYELSNGSHGADHGVFIAAEVRVLAHTPDGAVAEDGLVENLEEVDPDEDGEDVFICLATKAFVLR